jgi:trans-aconitate 2-methyltransferase
MLYVIGFLTGTALLECEPHYDAAIPVELPGADEALVVELLTPSARTRERYSVSPGKALDASAQMVEAAQGLQEPNLRFVRMDVLDADFWEEFDVVFSSATLHWVKDHGLLLGVLYQAVMLGGVVRLSFAGEGNCSRLIAVLQELMEEPAYQSAFRGFVWPWYMPALESYERLVREVPFSSARVWGEVADRHFPSALAMVGWIDQPSLVPFRQHLDGATGDRFRAEVIARMTARTREEDGRCFETFRRINVLARK